MPKYDFKCTQCHCGCGGTFGYSLPAFTVEENKTYVVELKQSATREQLESMAKLWKEQTNSKVVFLDGAKIVRNGVDEAKLREQIAREIENQHIDRDVNSFSDCWDIEYSEYICTHLADAAIARGNNA